ncbi:hypothetical protein AQ914_16010 [Burkholderia pseudomallei]|nr:hypothetical protein AQ914_16010 [Burkholderia pseudomallei]
MAVQNTEVKLKNNVLPFDLTHTSITCQVRRLMQSDTHGNFDTIYQTFDHFVWRPVKSAGKIEFDSS